MRRICAGERELFEQLLRRYNRRIYRVVRSVLRNEGDAEDVVQETWLRAFANLRQLSEPDRFAAWICRIALYEAWARARRDRRGRSGDGDGNGDGGAGRVGDPESAAASREIIRLLEDAIDALPEKYRIALVLRGVEGLTSEEVARHLKVSRMTVNTRFHRARALLRAELSARVGVLHRAFDFLGSRCRGMRERVMDGVAATARRFDEKDGRGSEAEPRHLLPLPARVDPMSQ